MFRGKTTINEVLNLPNRVFIGLLNIRKKELMSEEGKKAVAERLVGEELEDELEGGI